MSVLIVDLVVGVVCGLDNVLKNSRIEMRFGRYYNGPKRKHEFDSQLYRRKIQKIILFMKILKWCIVQLGKIKVYVASVKFDAREKRLYISKIIAIFFTNVENEQLPMNVKFATRAGGECCNHTK